jgi:radical SAM superfamily enzyme YgiQ (UPF0313 family)
MKRIILIYPGNDPLYKDLNVGYVETPPPTGLVTLANVLQNKIPNIEIRVLDGNYKSQTEIKTILSDTLYDIVGFTDWFTNHGNCLELAEHSKKIDSKNTVVFGGPNSSNLPSQILRNHNYIDYVVRNDGEDAIEGIVRGDDAETIPNLVYRTEGRIKFNQEHYTEIDKLPIIHYNFEDLKDILSLYSSNTRTYRPQYIAPFTLSSIRGCIKAVINGRCSYCSIPGNRVKLLSPKHFWDQVQFLHDRYGIRYFFETGDDFIVGDYPKRILDAKPANLNIDLRIYTHPINITKPNLEILKYIGVSDIFLGVENVSRNILSRSNKDYDTSSLELMLSHLNDFEIRPHLAFLFGLPGETIETVQANHEFAMEVIAKYQHLLKRVLYSLAIPMVGSEWFTKLLTDKDIRKIYYDRTGRLLINDDMLDYYLLSELSIQKYSSVSFEKLLMIIEEGEIIIENTLGKKRLTTFGNINKVKSHRLIIE